MTPKDKQFLIECLCTELVPMLMDEYGIDEQTAIGKLYRSKTFSKLEDSDTGLYYQGAVYVFEFLKEEFADTIIITPPDKQV